MGTNFYWALVGGGAIQLATGDHITVTVDSDDPRIHIGKRSAAGLYCYDCDVTLCPGGKARIHMSDEEWPKACPKCGATQADEGLRAGPVAVELGFAAPREERPTGVRGTSSFSWAQSPEAVRRTCEAHMDDEVIVDEYERRMTGRAFLAMLRANCAVEFTGSVGEWFS